MMVTDEDILEYLEHFGVKGMHWGVRKASKAGVSKEPSKQTKTDEQIGKDIQKFAKKETTKQSKSDAKLMKDIEAFANSEAGKRDFQDATAAQRKINKGALVAVGLLGLGVGAIQLASVGKEVKRGGW